MFSIAISLEARNLHASWHEVMMGSGVRSISGRPGSYYWISPEQPSSSPSARSRHVAVYDDAHGVMLVACLTTSPRMRHLTRTNDIRQFLRSTCGWNNREICCLCILFSGFRSLNTTWNSGEYRWVPPKLVIEIWGTLVYDMIDGHFQS